MGISVQFVHYNIFSNIMPSFKTGLAKGSESFLRVAKTKCDLMPALSLCRTRHELRQVVLLFSFHYALQETVDDPTE